MFRKVERADLDDVFVLLQELTRIDYSERDKEKCWISFEAGGGNGLVCLSDNKVVAYGSLVIENKIRGEVSGQIEDIVVSEKYRESDIGTKLVAQLCNVAKMLGCYRITLSCKESLAPFYSRNGFKAKEISMKKYLD